MAWVLLAGALLVAPAAIAAPLRCATAGLHQGYASHPTVSRVRETGYLTVLNRERALSTRTPMDRGLAIADAVGSKNARKYKVAEGMVRALRARHSLGPSGALLHRQIAFTQLNAREALLLGWLRALAAKSGKELSKRGTSIRTAGALQLLQRASALAPQAQAPQLALALALASVAPRRGKRACRAWQLVQTAARNGRKEAVGLGIAERAVRAVAKLRSACSRKQRVVFSRPISLPAAIAERNATPRAGGRQGGRPTQRSGDVYRKGVAFAAVAPVFKGYMNVPLVRDIMRRTRLDEILLYDLMKGDKTGDACIAALNATLWSRRLDPARIEQVAWGAVLRGRSLLSKKRKELQKLTISKLTAVEAMVLGYARVVAGWGLERTELPGDPPAETALPRQLFRHARPKLAMNAALGPVVAMLHTVDLQRQASLCSAAKRAESIAFVVRKSQLPKATKRVVLAATDMVKAQCATISGAKP